MEWTDRPINRPIKSDKVTVHGTNNPHKARARPVLNMVIIKGNVLVLENRMRWGWGEAANGHLYGQTDRRWKLRFIGSLEVGKIISKFGEAVGSRMEKRKIKTDQQTN